MGLNASFAGRSYPATPAYSVGREKIREFAAAVKATHSSHYDTSAAQSLGYADVVAPPTFAVLIAQRAEAQLIEDPEAGIDFTRVVHADERFIHRRPIVAGDDITTVLNVDAVTERAGISMVTTRCELFDSSGELVAEVVSSLAVRGADQ